MKNSASIIVLLSAYNAEATLPKALDSLLSQTFTAWRCGIVEDGSTDGTADILATYVRRDARFFTTKHAQRQGLTSALIELANETQEPFMARHDADDWSEPERFEYQLAWFQKNPEAAAVGSWFSLHTEDGAYLDTLTPLCRPSLIRRTLRHKNPLAHGSLLMRRTAYKEVGGYRSAFRYAQDIDLLLRLSEKKSIGCVPKVLYHHRLSASGVGRARKAQQKAYAELARASATLRIQQNNDTDLLTRFNEPPQAIDQTPVYPEEQMAMHLVKSGQKHMANTVLNQWMPASARGKKIKFGLKLLNPWPLSFKQFLYHCSNLWNLR